MKRKHGAYTCKCGYTRFRTVSKKDRLYRCRKCGKIYIKTEDGQMLEGK